LTLPHWSLSVLAFIKQNAIAIGFSVWEYWLGKTKKLAANSSWELIENIGAWVIRRYFRKGKSNMEKDVKLGTVGDVDLKLEKGIATISISAAVPGDAGIEGGAFVKCDAEKLLGKLFAEIEAKSPAGAVPIEETVKAIIIQAVKAIG